MTANLGQVGFVPWMISISMNDFERTPDRPDRLNPMEAYKLAMLGVIGMLCLIPGTLRMLWGSPEAAEPLPSCSRAAFRVEDRIDCTKGEPLSSREALWMGVLLDLNTVEAPALEVVPGIGPALSARIVADREAHGPFAHLDDVIRVRGVGPRTLERMRPFVTVRVP